MSYNPSPLPLPKASRIDHVVHVSDVHIPFIKQLPSDVAPAPSNFTVTYAGMQRIQQFQEVIAGLIEAVWKLPAVREGRAVVLIAGDLFDCKHAANAVTVKLLHELVMGLCMGAPPVKEEPSHYLPVYVIAGNHDIHMDIIAEEEEESSTTAAATRGRYDDQQDLLGALLAPLRERYPVAYISRTGVYGTPGSGALFGVLHVKDAMQPGNCSGHARAVEHIPVQHLRLPPRVDLERDGDARIFVYHGQVTGHRVSSSHGVFVDDRGTSGVPVPHLAETLGYDACMLGDVHTMQLHNMAYVENGIGLGRFSWDSRFAELDPRARKRRVKMAGASASSGAIPWAYSGSLLQLNAGERLFPHGFLAWDLRSRCVDAFHVRSDVGVFFCSLDADGSAVRVHNAFSPLCDIGNPSPLELSIAHPHVGRPAWLPRKAVVRMVTNGPVSTSTAEAMREALSRVGVKAVGGATSVARTTVSSTVDRRNGREGGAEQAAAEEEDDGENVGGGTQCIDLSRFGLPDAWVEYISHCFFPEENGPIDTAKLNAWKECLYRPESTGISAAPEDVPDSVKQKVLDRNAKILKRCTDWRESAQALALRDAAAGGGGSRYRLGALRWSWLLCFADDNYFDFSSVRGKVALLSAPNGAGKSSALEVLCLALFGQPMPSRGSKTNLADALCRSRPSDSTPGSCSLDVELEGVGMFRVSRSFSWSPPTNRLISSARVSRLVPPHDTLVTVKDGITGVNTWVAQHLGTLADFLLSTLLTQDGDSDFFAMKPADQRALLDNAMALDSARVMGEVLKDARLAHAAVLDSMNTAIETGDQSVMKNILPVDGDDGDVYERLKRVAQTSETASEQKAAEVEALRRRLQASRTLVEMVMSHFTEDDDKDSNEQEVEDDDDEKEDDEEDSRTQALIRERPSAAGAIAAHLERQIENEAGQWRARGTEPARWVHLWETGRFSACCEETGDDEAGDLSDRLASLRVAKQEAARDHRAKLDASHAAAAGLMSVSVVEDCDVVDAEVDAVRTKERRLEEERISVGDRLAEARSRKEAAARLCETGMPSDQEVLSSLRNVERLYERAKEDMTRHKSARAEADAAHVRKDEATTRARLTLDLSEETRDDDEGGEDTDIFDDEWFDTWKKERRTALETAHARYQLVPGSPSPPPSAEEEGDEEGREEAMFDRAHACAREEIDRCGRLLREAILTTAATTTTMIGEEDGKETDIYNDVCTACRKRREEDRRRSSESGAALSRLRECACRLMCRGSSSVGGDNEDDDALTLVSNASGALASAHRWLHEWEERAYSASCGAAEIFETRRRQLRRRTRAQVARDAAEAERWEDAAQEAQAAARASKRDYQEARDAYEHVRSAREEAAKVRTEAERDHESALERAERLRTALDDVRNEYERLRVSRTARAKETALEAQEAAERLEMIAREIEGGVAAPSCPSRGELLQQFVSTVEQSWEPWKKESARLGRELQSWKTRARRCLLRLEHKVDSIETRIANEETELTRLRAALSRTHMAVDACTQWRDTRARWKTYRDEVESAKSTLEELSGAMGGFTSWVYTHRALPALVSEVNALLATMNAGVKLDGTCKPEDAASLSWTLNAAPVYKSSGMQRFVASLAMRIALAQLGACSHACRQLIIDEGFVALDGYHIAHVPEFLHDGILATGRFESVLLVSHLEGVKDAADVVVPITRDRATATSRLRFSLSQTQ